MGREREQVGRAWTAAEAHGLQAHAGAPPAPRPRVAGWKFYSVIGAVATTLLFIGAMIASDPADNVRVGDPVLVYDETGRWAVTGEMRNRTGNRTYDEVTLVVEHLGRGDQVVGTSTATIADLEPGETAQFTVPVPGTGGLRFRLAQMTCESDGSMDARLCSLGVPREVR